MITIKYEDPMFIFYGTYEVRTYFDQYMHKGNFNDYFCYCGSGIGKNGNWMMVPPKDEFNKKDWKIVQAGFAQFGVDIDNLKETA